MGGGGSKAQPAQVPNTGEATTPIIESPGATCDNYIFNTTVVQARLNNTNVTTEIWAGGNQSSCSNPYANVDEVLLQEKLMNLSDYEEQDQYAGMAVILTDRKFTSENFSALSDEKEPFVYFVNVGENETQNGSCYRQYRYVDGMKKINDIGLELESIACNPSSVYMNNSCMQEKTSSSTPSLAVVQATSLPLIIPGLVVALITVIFIILFFTTKRKIQGMCNKNITMEDSAIDNRFEALNGSEKDTTPAIDIYNELRENEKRTNDDEIQENYHHLDFNFVKGEVDPSLYDHVTGKVDNGEVFISHG